jgi:hypothetical protein
MNGELFMTKQVLWAALTPNDMCNIQIGSVVLVLDDVMHRTGGLICVRILDDVGRINYLKFNSSDEFISCMVAV